MSGGYLAYCDLTRPGGLKKTIVAVFTNGDTDDSCHRNADSGSDGDADDGADRDAWFGGCFELHTGGR